MANMPDLFNHEYYNKLNWRTRSLLPINHNYNKICDILSFFQTLKHKKYFKFLFVLAKSETKP